MKTKEQLLKDLQESKANVTTINVIFTDKNPLEYNYFIDENGILIKGMPYNYTIDIYSYPIEGVPVNSMISERRGNLEWILLALKKQYPNAEIQGYDGNINLNKVLISG